MLSLREVERRFFDLLASSFIYFRPIDKWVLNGVEVSLPYISSVSPDETLVFTCDVDFDKPRGLGWLLRLDVSGCGLIYVDGVLLHGIDDEHKLIPIFKDDFSNFRLEFTSRKLFGESPLKFSFTSSSIAGVLFDVFSTSLSLLDLVNYAQRDGAIIDLLSRLAEKITITPSVLQVYAMARTLYGFDFKDFSREYRRIRWDYSYIASVYGDGVVRGDLRDIPSPRIEDVRRIADEISRVLDEVCTSRVGDGEVFLFGHSHIDTAWLWPYSETRRKILRTFSTINGLFKMGYNFTYVQSGAQNYRWLEDLNPELFDDVGRLISDGKWLPVGGMWVESDTQLISGESLARQFLYGQRYFMDKFNFKCEIGWLPDTFGFSAQLPQIMRKSGLKIFITHKVMWNDTNNFPYHAFVWDGIDGSSIIVHILPLTYNGILTANEIHDLWVKYLGKNYAPAIHSYGYGDGGGGPTFTMLERVKLLSKIPGLPKLILAPKQDEYINAMLKSSGNLPHWHGEIYNEFHRGVYTNNVRIKNLMWMAENEVLWSEFLSTILYLNKLGEYPRKDLLECWEVILRSQFHDVLPGTCCSEAYDEAYAELERVIERLKAISNDAFKNIIPTSSNGPLRVAIFNRLNWCWKALVELPKGSFRDQNGRIIESQEFNGVNYGIVEVPPLNYTVLTKFSDSEIVRGDGDVKAYGVDDGIILENEYLKVKIGFDATVKSIYDKMLHWEFISSEGNLLKVHVCKPGAFDAWDIEESTIKDPGVKLIIIDPPRIIANGPVFASVKYTLRYGESTVNQEIRIFKGSRLIEFKTHLNWVDKGCLLKAWFNLNVKSEKAHFEIPFGVVERSTIKVSSWDKAKFEVPALRWMDISDGEYGFAIISNSRHGYSVDGSTVGLSLLKSSVMPNPWSDMGYNEFTYYIYPHSGNYYSGEVYRRAYEVYSGVKTLVFKCNGEVPLMKPIIKVDGGILESLKLSESLDGIVARIYDISGKGCEVNVEFNDVFNVYEVDIIEDNPKLLAENAKTFRIRLNPFEIKTLLLIKISIPS
jgi:alpha-mannosidase